MIPELTLKILLQYGLQVLKQKGISYFLSSTQFKFQIEEKVGKTSVPVERDGTVIL